MPEDRDENFINGRDLTPISTTVSSSGLTALATCNSEYRLRVHRVEIGVDADKTNGFQFGFGDTSAGVESAVYTSPRSIKGGAVYGKDISPNRNVGSLGQGLVISIDTASTYSVNVDYETVVG